MPMMRTAQTMRNTLQAGRINIFSQARSAMSSMRPGILSLQEEGVNGGSNGANVTPPTEGIAGPMGMWSFPILNKLMGGEGMYKPSTRQAGLGTPSRSATRTAVAGTNMVDPTRSTGIRPY